MTTQACVYRITSFPRNSIASRQQVSSKVPKSTMSANGSPVQYFHGLTCILHAQESAIASHIGDSEEAKTAFFRLSTRPVSPYWKAEAFRHPLARAPRKPQSLTWPTDHTHNRLTLFRSIFYLLVP
jgi:hypothetical protein